MFHIITMQTTSKVQNTQQIIQQQHVYHQSHPVLIHILLLFIFLELTIPAKCCYPLQSYNSQTCTVCSSGFCAQYDSKGQKKSNTDLKCLQNCCDSSRYIQTNQTSGICGKINGSYSNGSSSEGNLTLATILIIIFFSIPAGICLMVGIITCVNNNQRRRRLRQLQQRNQPIPSAVNLAEYNMDDLGPLYQDRSQSCSICLQIDCNLRTKCKHSYHTQCLSVWVNKKQKCPLCVTRQFNPIILYCTNCFIQCKMVLLYENMQQDLAEQWNKYVEYKCQQCLNIQKDEIIISIDLQAVSEHKDRQRQLNKSDSVKKLKIRNLGIDDC